MATENIQSIGNFSDGKYATGRRKKSIAKVWLKKGSGNIFVNGKKYDEYFKDLTMLISYYVLLNLLNNLLLTM